MKNYIILFREPDGRMDQHSAPELEERRKHWAEWMKQWQDKGRLKGGASLTLEGRLLRGDGTNVTNAIHKVGKEIVGGFLLIMANDLDEATHIASSCPIFEANGYAEVREFAG